jgi:hypothetical protein
MSGLRVKFIAQNQAFDLTVTGLVPLTRHYVYFERQRQADSTCSPKGGAAGQALITDLNGKLTFTYFYSSGLPAETSSLEAAQGLMNTVAGVKELVLLTVDTPTMDDSTIRATLSFARSYITIDVLAPEAVSVVENVVIQSAPVYFWWGDWNSLGIGA